MPTFITGSPSGAHHTDKKSSLSLTSVLGFSLSWVNQTESTGFLDFGLIRPLIWVRKKGGDEHHENPIFQHNFMKHLWRQSTSSVEVKDLPRMEY
ncbi:hypothetical protein L1987_42039 [Smallanthus sonchifolius]|uniref:Uncharacterized protein n=1 Tax=Smallanthus sonchifolius TaxID=185202 RepID=A0ACB9GVJ2_9ASTR|nr:hypothetical protein L1987_42039 [Smallanthus sonchifolius]